MDFFGFCIKIQMHFLLSFHFIFFIMTQYMIHEGKKYGLEKNITKNVTNK